MEKIVCVCSSDCTRGPAMAEILRVQLRRQKLDAEVSSAAVDILKGTSNVSRRLKYALVQNGYGHLKNHKPTQITPAIIDGASLLLTASTNQRVLLEKISPKTEGKVYSLVDYATSGREVDVDIVHPLRYVLDTNSWWANPSKYQVVAKRASHMPPFLSALYLRFATDGMVDGKSDRQITLAYKNLVRTLEHYIKMTIPRLVSEGHASPKRNY